MPAKPVLPATRRRRSAALCVLASLICTSPGLLALGWLAHGTLAGRPSLLADLVVIASSICYGIWLGCDIRDCTAREKEVLLRTQLEAQHEGLQVLWEFARRVAARTQPAGASATHGGVPPASTAERTG